MNRIILLLFVTISLQSFSQNPYIINWENTYGKKFDNILHTCVPTLDKGYLLGGHTFGYGDDQEQDYWVVKIDSFGNLLWEKSLGGTSTDILQSIVPTSDKGFLLGGVTVSNDGDIQSGNRGEKDYWIIKVDSIGNILWEKTYGGSGLDQLYTIIESIDGGYFLGGYTESNDGDIQSGNNGEQDYWIVKIDSIGNILWEKSYGGSNEDILQSIVPTSVGGYLLGGYTKSNDGDIQSGNNGGQDYWIIEIDSIGNILWEKSYGGSKGEVLHSIVPTVKGYMVGGFTYSNDGDIQLGNNGGNRGSSDYWIIEIDTIGNILWEESYGGSDSDKLQSIAPTVNGGYLLGGYTESNDGDIQSDPSSSRNEYWVVQLSINTPPTNIYISNKNINENSQIGTMIGIISTQDKDTRDKFTYSLVAGSGDSDNSNFIISDDKLLSNKVFDFETKSSYSIRIQTEDSGGNIFSKSLNINIINLNDLIITDTIIVKPNCLNDLTGSIEYKVNEYVLPLKFQWSNGDTTQNLYDIGSGEYSVTILDGDSMTLNSDFVVNTIPIYVGTNICYITSDGKSNIIHIDKGMNNYNVEKYVFYREGVSQNEYEKIGEVSCVENYFIDSLINNRTQSFSYKVSMIDSCGNESPLSSNHNTIHLSQNRGTSGEVNLYWTHYVGLNVPSYSIFRQKENQDFELLKQISTNNNTYTDFTSNPSFNYQYYISFHLEDTCYTEVNLKSNECLEVKSNIVSTDSTSTEIQDFIDFEFKIYPNPVDDKLIIETNNSHKVEVRIFDVDGNQIMKPKEVYKKGEINLQVISSGIYLLRLLVDNTVVHQQKIVKY